MLQPPFYDPSKSYEDNYRDGPFGAFADGEQYQEKGQPQQSFLGLPVYLPFGIPAGPLLNAAFVKAAFAKGFDLCVYKTVRTRKYPCHPWPNVVPVRVAGDMATKTEQFAEPLSITNSFGVPSMEPDIWQPDMQRAVEAAGTGKVMIGSFQGTIGGSTSDYVSDFVLAARLVKETGVPAMEVNFSCPNEGIANLLCFDTPLVVRIISAVKDEIGNIPLVIKLAYFESDKQLSFLVRQAGSMVEGMAAINTIQATVVDEHGQHVLPGQGRERSGICGAVVKPKGMDMVKRLHQHRSNLGFSFSIIGVGGVMNPQDYQDYMSAGADAVMSATGAMWNPLLAKAIKEA